jgi:hypothetical protein
MTTNNSCDYKVLPFDHNLPSSLRITSEKLDSVESIWTQGHAVLAFRFNRLLTRVFPDSPQLQLPSSTLPSPKGHSHGLMYYHLLFCDVLPSPLVTRIPPKFELVRGLDNAPVGVIDLRDGERVFPWCLGFTSLGRTAKELDLEYLEIECQLRQSGHDAAWFESNVVEPTNAQAAFWQSIFGSWRTRLAATTPPPPPNLTQSQRDIWDVVLEAGHRLNTDEIYRALSDKGLHPGRSGLKQHLAELSNRRKVLPYRCDTSPPGYGLREWD